MQREQNLKCPSPVEFIEATRVSEIVLLCEHASNFMPAEYGRLGLTESDLERHIAWDIGAADLTRRLASKLGAPALLGTYSRLLIDLNRPLGCTDSIPRHAEDIAVPGNADLTEVEVVRRAEAIFAPFHDAVSEYLDLRRSRGDTIRLVTIHSFTPVYLGVSRPWHVGVLFGRAEAFARTVLSGLQEDPTLNATLNQPYVISRDSDYAIPIHGDDRQIDAILLEIRNDLINSAADSERWATRLSAILSGSLSLSPSMSV